jgi:hypothetical protein
MKRKRKQQKVQKHIAQFGDRTVSLTVIEAPAQVIFEMAFSKRAPWPNTEDFANFKRWVWEIIYAYDADPRPSVFRCPQTRETAIVIAPPDGPGMKGPPPWWG